LQDLLGNEIKEGSFIAYAARVGSHQEIKFAVVFEPEWQYGTKWRMLVRPVKFVDTRDEGHVLKAHHNTGGTDTTTIRSSQALVVGKETLPKGLTKVLEDAYCIYYNKKQNGTRLQDDAAFKRQKKKNWAERHGQDPYIVTEILQSISDVENWRRYI